MDQFWFPNGAERQNCTVSAPFPHHPAFSPWCNFAADRAGAPLPKSDGVTDLIFKEPTLLRSKT